MLAVLLAAMTAVVAPVENPELAAAAARFRVLPIAARLNWNLACKHPAQRAAEVYAWNRPDVAAQWVAECDWRRAAWDKLDDVLYHRCPVQYKLRSLERLRELLGDEAFERGVMPAPIPNYRD